MSSAQRSSLGALVHRIIQLFINFNFLLKILKVRLQSLPIYFENFQSIFTLNFICSMRKCFQNNKWPIQRVRSLPGNNLRRDW